MALHSGTQRSDIASASRHPVLVTGWEAQQSGGCCTPSSVGRVDMEAPQLFSPKGAVLSCGIFVGNFCK